MIGPVSCPDRDPWFLQAATLSRGLYDELNEKLHEETGARVDYGGQGELVIAFNDSEAERMKARAETQASDGVPMAVLTGEEVRKQEPALPEQVVAAIWQPESRFLDARNYTRTVARAACLKGVSIHEGWPVNGMLWEGNQVVGVRSGTEVLSADTVINAAGAWAGQLDPGLTLPIFPDHGQILSLEGPSCGLRHTISRWERDGYITQRSDGRVIVGATHDDWGFQKKITPEGLRYLHAVVRNLLPDLVDQPVLEIWSGLRPGTPDGLAVLGPDPRVKEGYLWAAGHSSYGMTQTPATAKVLADLVLGRTPSISTVQLRVERFLDKPRSPDYA